MLGMVLLMLCAACIFLYLIFLRQKALSSKLSASQKEMQESQAVSSSASKLHFEIMNEQLSALMRDQNRSSSLMDQLSCQMQAVSRVMTNTKMRGTWGEYQMENLIRIYTGDSPAVYERQYHLANGKIADGAFHLPGTEEVLCIDSKFPMENYLRIDESKEDREYYIKEFRKNMKKHIYDVASKYITPETSGSALLFLPSEGIYQFICGQCDDLMQYALKQHVLLVSPTTLAGVVFTLLSSTRDVYRAKNIVRIERELQALQEEFETLLLKADKAQRTLQNAAVQWNGVYNDLQKGISSMDRTLNGMQEQADYEESSYESRHAL